MVHEVRSLPELLRADLALVFSDILMHFHMAVESVLSSVGLPALWTVVGPVSAVEAGVEVAGGAGGEGLPAAGAGVRHEAAVREAAVRAQGGGAAVGAGALVAAVGRVRVAVALHVHEHVVFVGECFVALWTHGRYIFLVFYALFYFSIFTGLTIVVLFEDMFL